MKFDRVLVLGGSGFIGRHLVAELVRRGMDVTVPTRNRERAKRGLILLPTADAVEADVFGRGVLARLAKGHDAVINLIGILHGRRGRPDERGPNNYGPDFARAHVELPLAALAACRANGIKRLLHMSALGADPAGPSEYLRSKGIGEQSMLAAQDVAVTAFRPSVVFGPEDQLLNRFAELVKWLPVLGVPCPHARFQPVYVGDVAHFMADVLDEPQTFGKRYDLGGPQVYTMRELFEYVARITGHQRLIFGLPDWVARMQAWFLEHSPLPIMSRDNLDSMKVPSVCTPPFPFDIRPTPVEAVAPYYLVPQGPRERLPELRWRARR
jgi:NADH dehydrogenase